MNTVAAVDGLRLRRILGRRDWHPPQPYDVGWTLLHRNGQSSVVVSAAEEDGTQWIHASMAHEDRVPSYDELRLLHRAAFGDGWAYQVFAPPAEHISIHAYALHLWGRADGRPSLPNFGSEGSI